MQKHSTESCSFSTIRQDHRKRGADDVPKLDPPELKVRRVMSESVSTLVRVEPALQKVSERTVHRWMKNHFVAATP